MTTSWQYSWNRKCCCNQPDAEDDQRRHLMRKQNDFLSYKAIILILLRKQTKDQNRKAAVHVEFNKNTEPKSGKLKATNKNQSFSREQDRQAFCLTSLCREWKVIIKETITNWNIKIELSFHEKNSWVFTMKSTIQWTHWHCYNWTTFGLRNFFIRKFCVVW